MICIGFYLAKETVILLFNGTKTKGTVIQFTRQNSSTGTVNPAYYPIVEFTDDTGLITTFTSEYGSFPKPQNIGDHVTVYYDASQPQRAIIGGMSSAWVMPIILVTIGLAFCGENLLLFT